MAYTTKEQVEAYIKRDLTTNELTLLPGLLVAIQAYIDSKIGGSFGTVAETTRYYSGNGRIIDIDACSDITAVKLIDNVQAVVYTYVLDEELELLPKNDDIKTFIEKRIGSFPYGKSNISVTAKYSLGAVPDEIKYVATVMVGALVIEGVNPALISEGIEGYNRTFAVSLASGEISKKKEVIDTILESHAVEEVLI